MTSHTGTPESLPQLLSLAEAGDALHLSLYTLRRWAATRRIRSIKLGRRVLVPVEEIRRLIEEGTRPAER